MTDAFTVWARSMMAYGGAERLDDATPENAAASVIQTALNEARAEERRAAAERLRQVVAKGYPAPSLKTDTCQHGKYNWEDCIACYDENLLAAADAIEKGEHYG